MNSLPILSVSPSSRRLLAATLLACCWLLPGGLAAQKPVDLLVTGGTVVTMDAGRRVIERGAIAVRGDTIVAVGRAVDVAKEFAPVRSLDASGKLILPGLINGHTHAPMSLLRGIADDANLQDWLTKYIFPAEARNVSPDFVTWGTRLACLEMIKSGVTTYADMYYFEDDIASATKGCGMRGVLGETVIEFPAPDNKTTGEALGYTEKFLDHWKGDPLITAAIAPHSMYLLSAAQLRSSAALARRHHAPILIHVAETQHERDDSLAKYHLTPVAYLASVGLLGPDVVAAHCVWVDASDIATLARTETGCVHNPSSNMQLASGVAPVPQMLKAGVRLGLGTDGSAGGNHDLNLMEEMSLATELQKVTHHDPQALDAEQALAMATIGGARALHMEREIGSLEAGKKADFVTLDLDNTDDVPAYNLYSQIVYSLRARDVRTVVIGGSVVMEDGRVRTLDEREVLAKAREYNAQVKRSLAAAR